MAISFVLTTKRSPNIYIYESNDAHCMHYGMNRVDICQSCRIAVRRSAAYKHKDYTHGFFSQHILCDILYSSGNLFLDMIDSLFLDIFFRFPVALIAWIAALLDVVCDDPLPSATETKITKLFVYIKSLAITHKYMHTRTYVCVCIKKG